MITIEQLRAAITQRIDTYNHQDAPIAARAKPTYDLLESSNHILAMDVRAPFNIPRQNLSAMDGYAIAQDSDVSSNSVITIVGESQAGSPYTDELSAGQGVRIFTGAVVPDACDTVIMQENTNFEQIKAGIDKSQPYAVTLTVDASVSANIRFQGEEIQADEVVLTQGKRINPADISLLANLGVSEVSVLAPLVVGLIATGDELVALGEPLTSMAQIYNTNTPTLKALLNTLPITIQDYGIIPDDLEQTTAVVTTAMQDCDVLISSAGVSVGDYDFLTTVIEKLGQINHYKVAMKPGKPFVFGELLPTDAAPVLYFGLPGNPLSTVVGALQFVIPALWQLSGAALDQQPQVLSLPATLTHDTKKSVGRADFQRGVLSQNPDGSYQLILKQCNMTLIMAIRMRSVTY